MSGEVALEQGSVPEQSSGSSRPGAVVPDEAEGLDRRVRNARQRQKVMAASRTMLPPVESTPPTVAASIPQRATQTGLGVGGGGAVIGYGVPSGRVSQRTSGGVEVQFPLSVTALSG